MFNPKMRTHCAVCNVGKDERQMFYLPRNKSRAIVWLDKLGLSTDNIEQLCGRILICSNHFGEDCFTTGTRNKLNRTAIPTILLDQPKQRNEDDQSSKIVDAEDDYTTNIEWNNKCIACLKDEVPMETISTLSVLTGFKQLFQYLGIEDLENGNLYNYACANCVLQMHIMLNFKKQCEESQKKLKLLTSTSRDEKIHTSNFYEDQTEMIHNEIKPTNTRFKDKLSSSISLSETKMYAEEELYLDSHATPYDQKFDSTPLQETCVTCKGKFPDKIWLKRHQILIHGLKDCIAECSRCKFYKHNKFEYLLKYHKDHYHDNICGTCHLNFETIFHLAQHNLLLHTFKTGAIDDKRTKLIYGIHNKRRKKLISCSQCNKVLLSRSLRMHMQRKHNSNRTKNSCTICKKAVYNLRLHLKTHLKAPRQRKIISNPNPKDALCVHCGKFYGRVTLKQHILGVHYGIKNYECTYCNKMFKTATQRKSHVQRIHLRLKRFTCCLCDQKFFFKNSLKLHMLKHTGERPFKCPYCGLSLRGNLKRHIRQKHGC